jgi:hypothetical protein
MTMDFVMQMIAWTITIGMLGGAFGGWMLFLIALINDLRSSGKFEMLGRLRPSFKPTALGRRWAR